eukprot:CAMPEP_0179960480 /NCGR_PEP_ID=MMETSP0983-20121128/29151_1 /TAXON_ID=483367 /ORGANISM="non described non described, Strain CCMP 2436" /LENGTH=43 /DNA_ID= /DNA_START= /DNA_END= /DNA_ORIENTATION=
MASSVADAARELGRGCLTPGPPTAAASATAASALAWPSPRPTS